MYGISLLQVIMAPHTAVVTPPPPAPIPVVAVAPAAITKAVSMPPVVRSTPTTPAPTTTTTTTTTTIPQEYYCEITWTGSQINPVNGVLTPGITMGYSGECGPGTNGAAFLQAYPDATVVTP